MPFDPKRYQKVQEILGEPELYPAELLSWILKKLTDNPYFQVSQVQLPAVDDWTNVGGVGGPSFTSPWAIWDPSQNPPRFRKDPFGTVFVEGLVKTTSAASVSGNIFTLPVGYRPSSLKLTSQLGAIGGVEAQRRIDFHADGTVTWQGTASTVQYVQIEAVFKAFSEKEGGAMALVEGTTLQGNISAPPGQTPQLLYPGATPAGPAPAVTPQADPRAPSGGGGGGGSYDWNSIMQQMASWLQGSSQANAMRDQAAAARRAAIQQLAVKYGGLPEGFQDKYGDYDAATQALAGQNQFADTKLLAKRYTDSQEQLKRQLAARRALSSGETGYGMDRLDTQKGIDEYNLGNEFLSGVNNQYAQFGDRMSQAYAIEAQAAQAARMEALQLMMLQSQGNVGSGGSGGVGGYTNYGSEFPITQSGIDNLLIKEPYDYVKGSDIRYLTPNYGGPTGGWISDGDGWIGPDGRRYDQEGRVR